MRTVMMLCAFFLSCRTVETVATQPAVTVPERADTAIRKSPPVLRLGDAVVPVRYRLELTVLPESKTLPGKVSIDAQVKTATSTVWFNATELKILKATVNDQMANVVAGNDDFVGLSVPSPLSPGLVKIEIEFEGAIDFARSRGVYSEKEGGQRYAYTFFEPIDARRAFPCFDEPNFKVPWTLTLHVKSSDVALANAPVMSETSEGNDMKRVVFEETPPLPSYLVAFVVGPFEVIDGGSASGVPIRFVVPKGRAAELEWSKEVTPKVVTALVNYFQMGFPFKKLDVAVVPRYWGTMEHPGLVAMGQTLALIRSDQMTRSRKQSYANILSHELGHYWFGDLVTMAWWNDTWLNESFGEWVDLFITDSLDPAWNYRDRRVGIANGAMNADELSSALPIRSQVTTRQGIESSFDGQITYFKGSSIARMFEYAVGPSKWQRFIQKYLTTHARKNVEAKDFLDLMTQELGPEVSNGFAGFLERPGVPLVTAKVDCSGSKPVLKLTQRRSMAFGTPEPAQATTWSFPVCLRFGDGKNSGQQCVQMSSDSAQTSAALEDIKCPHWILPNADARGYYRSAVAPSVSLALLDARSAIANQAKPTVAEQWMLVADLSAAVGRGDVAVDEALRAAPLVASSKDERLALAAPGLLAYRSDALDNELFQRAQKFERKTFVPLARALGWKRGVDDLDDRQALRISVLRRAIEANDTALIQEGAGLLRIWLQHLQNPSAPNSVLTDDLVGLALVAAGKSEDPALYEAIAQAIAKAPDRQAQARLIAALGYFTTPPLVAKSLERVLSPTSDMRETSSLLFNVLDQRASQLLAWTWLQSHLSEVLAKMRSDEAAGFLEGVAGLFCDTAHVAQAEALIRPQVQAIDGAEASVTRGFETSKLCVAKQARDLPALKRFFATF
jgi:aminopeptidase N